ncbi:MAG TPA: 1-acyl-sn-glycerol-3-phosphate acyltransferase [Bacteroidetes bacterium]|nr:1-acyl-sn-glycerol-3-phosphate acyltransferase [Bacteroidota bacterium]
MNNIGTGKNFPRENPGLFDRALCYIMVNFTIIPTIQIFMNLLNRTRIIGRKNLAGLKPPWILMSNHLTLLDDLFIDPLIFFPKGFLGYRYIPYNVPKEKNFYKHAITFWLMRRLKSIPVIRGRGIQQEGVNRLISAVKRGGILHIYPEGTRTRNGQIGAAKDGIARIVYETGAPVVPVYHQGLEKVLPIGSAIPNFGKEIRIAIGKPLSFQRELEMENDINTWRLITNRIMDGIREQQRVMNERWGARSTGIRTVKTIKQSSKC